MNHLDRAIKIVDGLDDIEARRGGVEEAAELNDLIDKLRQRSYKLKSCVDDYSIFGLGKIDTSKIDSVSKALETVGNVSSRFREDPRSKTLKGNRWKSLTGKLDVCIDDINDTLKVDWQKFFTQELFGGGTPEQRFTTLVKTEENKALMSQYESLYSEFRVYRSQIPPSLDQLERLKEVSNQLTSINFQEDVSDQVKAFFFASNIGASLELVTEEVLTFLKENNSLDKYIVKAKQ